MYANMNRVKAQDVIHQGNLSPTDFEGTYKLYLSAFGNEELARKAQSLAAERYADARIAQHAQRR